MKAEFENSIRRLSVLWSSPDIKIAWINPCKLSYNKYQLKGKPQSSIKIYCQKQIAIMTQHFKNQQQEKHLFVLDQMHTKKSKDLSKII